jgi:hypothetical protein
MFAVLWIWQKILFNYFESRHQKFFLYNLQNFSDFFSLLFFINSIFGMKIFAHKSHKICIFHKVVNVFWGFFTSKLWKCYLKQFLESKWRRILIKTIAITMKLRHSSSWAVEWMDFIAWGGKSSSSSSSSCMNLWLSSNFPHAECLLCEAIKIFMGRNLFHINTLCLQTLHYAIYLLNKNISNCEIWLNFQYFEHLHISQQRTFIAIGMRSNVDFWLTVPEYNWNSYTLCATDKHSNIWWLNCRKSVQIMTQIDD